MLEGQGRGFELQVYIRLQAARRHYININYKRVVATVDCAAGGRLILFCGVSIHFLPFILVLVAYISFIISLGVIV